MPSQVAESGTDFFPLSPSISHQSMPPKRKADKGKQSQSKRSKADDEPTVDEKDNTSLDETNIASSSDNSNNDKNDAGSLNDKLQKFKELRRRRATEVEQGNRRDRNLEFQRSKENPRYEAKLERKRKEAEKLLEKQKAIEDGEDYERKLFWKFSAESVEAWEEKMAKKAERANVGFTDYNQLAHKKYQKLISELKPDLGQYAEKKLESIERAIRNGEDPSNIDAIANNVDYGSLDDKPSKEAIDRLVQGVKREIHTRETRSRERKEIQDDISWINEKNRVFNQKIARFYDKYTKEIRENLERGTAL
ncbi:syf2 splicing factor family protein [Lichtheimia corymbifera JMRC:FSU:9682]|uniref:Pre-mRNA-splicing factor SYF2 n=1 Tax=Lichtheimia corymbifera JMRC:FSU:9682 TaxID=1263082 RepID=A0A068RPR1_9FUNG|nr:syf2 splicing factor family protein [Lichtheimia corymbifera JMRC:FSU:9682]